MAYIIFIYNNCSVFEFEEINIFYEWFKIQGVGKVWFGDYFKVVWEYIYLDLFQFDNFV